MESPIHPYDVLMRAVLVGTTIFGAWKGMAWQLASLASVVVSAPLVVLVLVFQRWITSGLTMGAVKG